MNQRKKLKIIKNKKKKIKTSINQFQRLINQKKIKKKNLHQKKKKMRLNQRALDIWYLTINHVEDIDDRLTWGSWEEGSRRNEIIPALGCYFDHRTSEEDCRQIALRIDRLWRKTGHPELAKATRRIRGDYRSMWYDIYYMCLP